MTGKKFVWLMLLGFLVTTLIVPGVAGAQDQSAEKKTDETDAAAIETQAYLGLGVGPLPAALTAQLPDVIGKGRGVMVEHVMQESPAAKAGFQNHDILIRYKEQDLFSPEQLVKLVRNDEPGSEVTIDYVRAGKVKELTLKLGEVPAREPVRRSVFRPPFENLAETPAFQQQREEMQQQERQRQNDPEPWATFKSMTITKMEDGQYKAEIDYRNKDEQILHRDYIGTREEIRKSIENDAALPDKEKKHLLRSLDQQSPRSLRMTWPRGFRSLFDLERENFNWPNLDF